MGRGNARTTSIPSFLIVVTSLLLSVAAAAAPIGQEFLPPEHWAYRALERFEALGLVRLPSHRPFTRPDVVRYVEALKARVGNGEELSPRDRFEMERLDTEFFDNGVRNNPRIRRDRPLLYAVEEPFHVEGDLDLSLIPKVDAFDSRWEFFVAGNPELRLHLREWLTYEVRYRVIMGPEHGDRARNEKPSPREKSFKGLTSLYERAYITGSYKSVTLFWGRDYADWGPVEFGNLILAETAGSLDKFGGRLRFKNMTLLSTHANMSAEIQRRFSGHRLEVRFGDLLFGVDETVVYSGRGFDPVYLLPLSSFYSNQFNERSDDNIIWSFDAKYDVLPGLQLYGGLLIDDFQFERDGLNPDKIAFDAGARVVLRRPIPVTMRAQYRYADIYTYSHRDSTRNHVTGSGDPDDGESPLGAPEGPDADRFTLEVDVYPRHDLTARFRLESGRRGEGNDFLNFETGMDPFPPFPSGTVEKTLAVGGSLLWDLPRNSSAEVTAMGVRVENMDHVLNKPEWSPAVQVRLTWDI